MRIRFLILSATLLGAVPARADVATSKCHGGENQTRLYYVDRADLVRAGCPDDTVVYDRAACTRDPARVSYVVWLDKMDHYFESDAVQLARRRDQEVVNLARVEAKIDEVLAGSAPREPVDALAAEIQALEADRAGLVVAIKDYEDQSARILERLRQVPSPDLQTQLAALAGELRTKREALSALDARRAGLRRQLIDAYALGNDEDFQELSRMRSRAVQAIAGIDSSLLEAARAQAEARRYEGRIFDQNFSWPIPCYSRGSGIKEAFGAYMEGYFSDLTPGDD